MQTIAGTGTMLYGRANRNADGSFISTKWLVFFFFPIIPLSSYRVWSEKESVRMPDGTVMLSRQEKINFNILETSQNLKMQKVNFNLKQIRNTYIFGGLAFILLLICISLIPKE